MTLVEALRKLSVADQREVKKKLDLLVDYSAVTRNAHRNLYAEMLLPLSAWDAFFRMILAATADVASVRKAVIYSLRSWTLKGPEVVLGGVRFGRAVTADIFCRLLVEETLFSTVREARIALKQLTKKALPVVVSRWKRLELGKYLLWSTLNPDMKGADPFEGISLTADAIRGHLGLDRSHRGKPLLLLEFVLPVGVVPRFPTVAEAYAAETWNYFFCPAPASSPVGLTMPWPEYEDNAPRPEVVHAVIAWAQLASRPKEVK